MTLHPARDAFVDASSFPSLFESQQAESQQVDSQLTQAQPTDSQPVAEDAQITAEIAPVAEAETPEAQVEAEAEVEINVTFAELGVPQRLVATLARENITAPFPIQAATIPDAIDRPRRARPRPDRLGQDARLRPAAAGPDRGQRQVRADATPRP